MLRLRDAGYDVEFILETMPGRRDEEILARPDISDLLFVTGDKGFGNWMFNLGLPRPFAIILDRLPHAEWAETADRILAILEAGVPAGQMITLTKDGIRTKPFPIGASDGRV